ncbi:MAG: cysteine desulfurase family protein [Bryobacteraceae bacterium]
MPSLYCDHNATTYIAPEVAETMAAAARDIYGNPSSIHAAGQLARQALEKSRRTLADFLHAAPDEFVFTSGGTESNNLTLLGVVRNLPGARKHVITTSIEHPAVLETCRQLEREGVEVTFIEVENTGLVHADRIRQNLHAHTVLISVMHANNEVGAIQPIQEIAALVREARASSGQEIYLHSDGVQAFAKIDSDVQQLGVDLYSVTAHKIFGPKGVGGLFVRKGTPLHSIQYGGRHERGRRPGTENVPGAMAFARAVELYTPNDSSHVAELRDLFEAEMLAAIPDLQINGTADHRLPNTSNLLFPGISAEALAIALDMKGIAVSTGAACSSGSTEPSHVMLAMGRTREDARSSVRFSFGRYNTREEVSRLVGAVVACLEQLRNAKQERRLVGV